MNEETLGRIEHKHLFLPKFFNVFLTAKINYL